MLCPNIFKSLEYLIEAVTGVSDLNLLCIYFNPTKHVQPEKGKLEFEFLGYDLVEVNGSISALTNCGGFPNAFNNRELTKYGLLPTLSRVIEVQSELYEKYPEVSESLKITKPPKINGVFILT